MNAIDRLTADDFVGYLGSTVRLDGIGPDLVLDKIDRREFPGWEEVTRKPFVLIFRGPPAPILPEGLYPIEIVNGPTVTLYVIPILTAACDHQDYQVVFN